MQRIDLIVNECFNKEAHLRHVWHEHYVCTGKGYGEDGYALATQEERDAAFNHFRLHRHSDDDTEIAIALGAMPEAPAVLDGRQAYGNRVVNMRQQADMYNAYLDGRTIEAHDVPMLFILTKIHRLGRMPDYADNYNDIDGYMQIAREVIGTNMIEAATAKEYQAMKENRWIGEAPREINVEEQVEKDLHPADAWTPNKEAEAEAAAMNAHNKAKAERLPWTPCGRPIARSVAERDWDLFGDDQVNVMCGLNIGHKGKCIPEVRVQEMRVQAIAADRRARAMDDGVAYDEHDDRL